MVKITDPNEPEEKITQRKKEAINKAFNEDPTQRQTKKMKIQLRLTPAVEQQLRQYAEVKGTTVTDAVEQIVNKKFHDKKINRQYYNLDQQATILLPRSMELLKHYGEKQINMVANITETSNEQYTINSFDKQASLFTNHPEDLQVVTIQQVNNAFDTYNDKEECYFSLYNLDPTDEEQNPLLNHTGLIMLVLGRENEEGKPENIRIPVFVHTYNGSLQEAKVMAHDAAILLAEKRHNPILRDYLDDLKGIMNFEEIESLLTVNLMLSEQVAKLADANAELQIELMDKEEMALDEKTRNTLDRLTEENIKLRQIVNNIDKYAETVIEDKVYEKIEQAKKETLQQVLDTFNGEMKNQR